MKNWIAILLLPAAFACGSPQPDGTFSIGLIGFDSPESIYEGPDGIYIFDGPEDLHLGGAEHALTFPENWGVQGDSTKCEIKEGFYNFEQNLNCYYPDGLRNVKIKIDGSSVGQAYEDALDEVIEYYFDNGNGPWFEWVGSNADVVFKGFDSNTGGAAARTTYPVSGYGPWEEVRSNSNGAYRGEGMRRKKALVRLHPNPPGGAWTPTNLRGALCHEMGHVVGLSHPSSNDGSCMWSTSNGIALNAGQRARLAAVSKTDSSGPMRVIPRVPGDNE